MSIRFFQAFHLIEVKDGCRLSSCTRLQGLKEVTQQGKHLSGYFGYYYF